MKDCLKHSIDHNDRLPSFTSLHYLSIGLRSLETRDSSFTVPPHQLDLISTLLSGELLPALEALNITFSWGIPRSRYEEIELLQQDLVVPNTNWAALEDTLLNPLLFPRLRAIRLRMHVVEYRHYSDIYKDYRSTDDTELGCVLRDQLLAAVPRIKDSGLILDVGVDSTIQRGFERIAKQKLGAAWTYESLR